MIGDKTLNGWCTDDNDNSSRCIDRVASELDALRCVPVHSDGLKFPSACKAMLYSLPGNSHCMDCNSPRPSWASITYGTLLCLSCSGRHRSYGVRTSFVRSIDMDSWSHQQVLAMLEGGNEQLTSFFERHRMVGKRMTCQRYRTKAAKFYSTHLKSHVESVANSGAYKGREEVRRKVKRTSTAPASSSSPSSTTTTATTSTSRAVVATTSQSCSPSTQRHARKMERNLTTAVEVVNQ